MHTLAFIIALLSFSSSTLASPTPRASVSQLHYEIARLRVSSRVKPAAITNTVCTDPNSTVNFHDENVAELSICGGIAGSITKCQGSPQTTTGSSGNALFSLTPTVAGATINISKNRWESCVRAARAVCPTGDFKSTCIGGASRGDVDFTLEEWSEWEVVDELMV